MATNDRTEDRHGEGTLTDIHLQSERSLVAACIIRPDNIDLIDGKVAGSYFRDAALGHVLDFLVSLRREGVGFDDITVLSCELRDAGLLDDIGGIIGLRDLLAETPHSDHVRYHAKRITDQHQLRKFSALGRDLTQRTIRPGADPAEIAKWWHEQKEITTEGVVASEKPVAPVAKPAMALFESYLTRLRQGEGDKLYRLPQMFSGVEIGPGLISIIGAPPGSGKTAVSSQMLFGALERTPALTAVIANAEMTFDVLVRRELARRTGIADQKLRFAKDLTPSDFELIEDAAVELTPLMERIDFAEPPFSYERLKEIRETYKPGFLILDYLQKFAPGGDPRVGVNAVMAELREFAFGGWAVLAMSSTSRTKGPSGASHDSSKLNLASFKESGEVEFNTDSAYILCDAGPHDGNEFVRKIKFTCVKNRHSEKVSKDLLFDMPRMSFEEDTSEGEEWDPSNDPFAMAGA